MTGEQSRDPNLYHAVLYLENRLTNILCYMAFSVQHLYK